MKSSKICLAADLGAEVDGSSPMLSTATASNCARSTVQHLDTRILDGKKTLIFGPFAAWTTKFLHRKGSFLDLPLSVKPNYLATLIKIGIHNLDLV